jgi:chaperonin GroES
MLDDLPADGAPAPADAPALAPDQLPALAAPPHTMLPKPEILDKLRRWADPNQTVNICDELDPQIMGPLGMTVCRQRDIDEGSREKWVKDSKSAMELAMQISAAKDFPWPDASNVIYPIVSMAAVQFNARAYPAIVPDRNVVKGTVYGKDEGIPEMDPATGQPILGPDGKPLRWVVPPGAKRARADRIAEHMSYQLLEEMTEWQDETDRLLLILPIVGCAFRKSYFDSAERRPFSILTQAKDLVVNYWAKSMETAPRITEEMKFYPHEIETLMRKGVWRKVELGPESDGGDDEDAPRSFYEQHRLCDFDGDGYAEPYICTVHRDTQTIVRIQARYEDEEGVVQWSGRTGEIVKVEPTHYYTKFDFLPNPQGAIYGVGFGQLLKPLNESVNTALNQLFDAGTLQNTGGGFIGRGLSMQTGSVQRKLGEWKVLNVPGNKIREAIVPAPLVQPSDVLFKLLGFLVEAAKELGSNTELMSGQQKFANMPATSVLALIEQGSKVFTGIYKRVFRSETQEFDKLYRINRLYLDDVTGYRRGEEWREIERSDYEQGGSVQPVSDPSMVSDMQQLARAEFLKEFLNDPYFNGIEVRRRMLMAAKFAEVEQLLLKQMLPNPEIQLREREIQIKEIAVRSKAVADYAMGVLNLAKAGQADSEQHFRWLELQMAAIEKDIEAMNAGQAASGGTEELELRGVRLSDFNHWKHHPVTRLFRRYLEDKADDMVAAMMLMWLGGGVELAVEQEARSTVNVFKSMATLLGPDKRQAEPALAQIAAFYAAVDTINEAQARDDDSEDDAPAEDQD